jgi:hypothetical protein
MVCLRRVKASREGALRTIMAMVMVVSHSSYETTG